MVPAYVRPPQSSNELKAKIWLGILDYISPKLRAVDQTLSTPDGAGLRIEIVRVASQTDLETEALIERAEPRLNGRAANAPYQKG
jgi:hypothetical protein